MTGDVGIKPAVLVTGASRCSLGAALMAEMPNRHREWPIVAVDNQHNPDLDGPGIVRSIELNLNPFDSTNSYDRIADEVSVGIENAHLESGFPGIGIAIRAAGTYDFGRLVDLSMEARKRLIGVNVCGKNELVHGVLRINQTLRFDSPNALTLVSVALNCSVSGIVFSRFRKRKAPTIVRHAL